TYRIFGIPSETPLTFDKFMECVHPNDREYVIRSRNEAGKNAPFNIEHRIVVDGKVKWVREIADLEFDAGGNVIQRIGTVQDITEQKVSEERIHLMNAELELRIDQRTKQLEEANQELEAFAYSVSHDLRAPLRSITGFSKLLHDEFGNKLNEEGLKLLGHITQNSKRMNQLIDDILEFSRMGRASIAVVHLKMQELVQLIINDLTRHLKEREINVNVLPLKGAQGDMSLIRQVWINLVSNAIKYSMKKEKTLIEIGCFDKDREVCYYIRDNGCGFDMKYYEKLFGVFHRLHSLHEYEGTGVGLALVKRIINRHGGTVWAEGKVDEGATFFFSLPAL
ncbi:MAG TPA: ATP-binding protein, partial [Cyclobacteriaceae bacterium]|nr:ATP-binding protein [Cyclobacteriaceae bacterium]